MNTPYDLSWDVKAMKALRNYYNYFKKNASVAVATISRSRIPSRRDLAGTAGTLSTRKTAVTSSPKLSYHTGLRF